MKIVKFLAWIAIKGERGREEEGKKGVNAMLLRFHSSRVITSTLLKRVDRNLDSCDPTTSVCSLFRDHRITKFTAKQISRGAGKLLKILRRLYFRRVVAMYTYIRISNVVFFKFNKHCHLVTAIYQST